MIRENVDLQPYNTFGILSTARYLAEVSSLDDIRNVLSDDIFRKQELLILGGGSNVLFTKNVDGAVILNRLKGIEVLEESENDVLVEANAGTVWHDLVKYCVSNGLCGIENLSLIPGNVGAAPMQNIGAYGVEIKDVFHGLTAMDLSSLETKDFSADECEFGYRESVFKRKLKGRYLITSVRLRLSKNATLNTGYGAIEQELESMNISAPTAKDVSNAVINIRRSKLPDPAELGNAGSFFKNPVISLEAYKALQNSHPNVPNYPAKNGVKLAAGHLIEQCGWKGKQVGNCGSHKHQALVIVNYGNCTGQEVFDLSKQIMESVKQKFNIQLEREVNVI